MLKLVVIVGAAAFVPDKKNRKSKEEEISIKETYRMYVQRSRYKIATKISEL